MSGDASSGDREVPRIRPEHLRAIYAQAREEFPRECCGYLAGDGDAAEVVRCTNVADKLHALDPELYPRTAENGYSIHGRELITLMESFDSPRPARIIYHSHPRVGAYFSEEDTRSALATEWPVDYLVIDAQEDEIKEAILFRRQGDRYEQIARFDGAPS